MRFKLLLIVLLTSTWAEEELPKRSESWQAKVFAVSALLAAAAGVAIICFDGGTPNKAIEANNAAADERRSQCCSEFPRTCCPTGEKRHE